MHFSTVFPLERRDMVMGGAAERRLQASHRHRCTWWRAMVPPWCIHSLVRSLVCRVDRRPAAASDLRMWLGGRCELPHEDDWVSSAGSQAQQTTCSSTSPHRGRTLAGIAQAAVAAVFETGSSDIDRHRLTGQTLVLDQARARRKFCLWYNTRLSNALLFENDWTGTLVVHRKEHDQGLRCSTC